MTRSTPTTRDFKLAAVMIAGTLVAGCNGAVKFKEIPACDSQGEHCGHSSMFQSESNNPFDSTITANAVSGGRDTNGNYTVNFGGMLAQPSAAMNTATIVTNAGIAAGQIMTGVGSLQVGKAAMDSISLQRQQTTSGATVAGAGTAGAVGTQAQAVTSTGAVTVSGSNDKVLVLPSSQAGASKSGSVSVPVAASAPYRSTGSASYGTQPTPSGW